MTHIIVADNHECGAAHDAARTASLAGPVHIHDLHAEVTGVRRPQVLSQPLLAVLAHQLLLQHEAAQGNKEWQGVKATMVEYADPSVWQLLCDGSVAEVRKPPPQFRKSDV